jgi:hypothetical protein
MDALAPWSAAEPARFPWACKLSQESASTACLACFPQIGFCWMPAPLFSDDGSECTGHPIRSLVTLVDPERFRGTSCGAAKLGVKTAGRGKQSNSHVPSACSYVPSLAVLERQPAGPRGS